MVVGDAAYPMMSWLMRPYTGANLTPKQKAFNYRHSSVRIVVENAFGRLKARWRILKRQLDVHIEEVPFIIGACCILHNLCENSGTPPPPDHERNDEDSPCSGLQPDPVIDSSARETIADFIYACS